MEIVQDALANFKKLYIKGKGSLSVVLVVTHEAKEKGLPLDPKDFRTAGHGQVKGLSREAVQKILNNYGLTQVLAAEGGRTNRGSLGIMEKYIVFLNKLDKNTTVDLSLVESWWIERVKEFFAGKPFKLHADHQNQ